jgi:hypothetical protein
MAIAGSNNIYFPTGTQVLIKATGDSVYSDIGCILAASTGTHNYETDIVECSTGEKVKRYKNQTIAGAFTLGNLNPENLTKMSGGMFTYVTVDGTPYTPADQTITSGWVDKSIIAIDTEKLSTVPVITSVTGGTDGALLEDDDYTIIEYSPARSGYAIILNTAGTILTTTAQDVVIDFGSNTPLSSESLTCGDATGDLDATAFKFVSPPDNGKSRVLEIYSATPESGGFVFGFTDVATGGIEQMPITITGDLDTSRTSGDQLFKWSVEAA